VVKCWECDQQKATEIPDAISDPKVRLIPFSAFLSDVLYAQIKSLVDGVMQSLSSARQSEVKAWEEEIAPCEHTLTLEQHEPGTIPPFGKYRHYLYFSLTL
jgi:ubiquitin carboxyl-terminal hydrolase 5/13